MFVFGSNEGVGVFFFCPAWKRWNFWLEDNGSGVFLLGFLRGSLLVLLLRTSDLLDLFGLTKWCQLFFVFFVFF